MLQTAEDDAFSKSAYWLSTSAFCSSVNPYLYTHLLCVRWC